MIILSGAIQAIHGLMQYFGYAQTFNSNFIITGNFSNPGPYCGFLAIIFVISIGIIFFREDVKKKQISSFIILTLTIISILTIVLIVIVFFLINSRAAFVSILLGSTIMIMEKWNSLKVKKNHAIFLSMISTLFISFAYYFLFLKNNIDSSNGRILIWKVTTEIIKDNPIYGVGFDNFKAHYMNLQADYFRYNFGNSTEKLLSDEVYYSFNEFIQFFSENGIVGLLLMILSVIFYYQTNFKNQFLKVYISSILGSILGFAAFSYPSSILPIKIIFVFFVTLVSLDSTDALIKFNINIFQNNRKKIVSLLVSALTILLCLKTFYSLNDLKASYELWNKANINYYKGNFKESKMNFESAFPLLKNNGDFLMMYGKTCTLLNENQKAVYILNKAKFFLANSVIEIAIGNAYKELGNYKKAEESYLQANFMIPNRFYPLYLLAKLYEKNGKIDKAKQIANEIMIKEIKINSLAIQEIKDEMELLLSDN